MSVRSFLDSLRDSATVDQLMGQIRGILWGLGGLGVGLGLITQEHMNTLVLQILAVAGPALLLLGSGWGILANSQFSIRKAAAKLPENQP